MLPFTNTDLRNQTCYVKMCYTEEWEGSKTKVTQKWKRDKGKWKNRKGALIILSELMHIMDRADQCC